MEMAWHFGAEKAMPQVLLSHVSGLSSMHMCRCWSWGAIGRLRSQTWGRDLGYTSVADFHVIVEEKGVDKVLCLPQSVTWSCEAHPADTWTSCRRW